MDFASSYALGSTTPMQRGPALAPRDASPLPTPRPQRMHWSTLLFTTGMAICAVALLATVAGVPGKMGYDIDGAPNRNEPSSMDPLKLTQSIDGNMKWIAQQSGDGKGGYVGYIQSVNRSEAAIPAMMTALIAMDASVRAIDTGLAGMGAATTTMGDDIAAMGATSAASGETMRALGSDIGFLSRSMVELAGATEQLTARMAAIERKAAGIADGGTSEALRNTEALGASLPDGIPVPVTTDGEPYDVAMQRLATAHGGGAGAAAATAHGGASFR